MTHSQRPQRDVSLVAIFRVFGESRTYSLKTEEIATAAGLSPRTVHRVMNDLESRGIVRRLSGTRNNLVFYALA